MKCYLIKKSLEKLKKRMNLGKRVANNDDDDDSMNTHTHIHIEKTEKNTQRYRYRMERGRKLRKEIWNNMK